ncbi:2-oxo acid dehydrogenase subunit E2 [Litorilinea aerophila]|uniref:Dihydrolipoamide acetyltransferase component of pyruvate dehydrogenase complex n=1 Tax=Litorilinea aerophila TaxID=1204385 RepID=A0A540VEX3_9CHLR|nr:dihydrolipoamide acetyltransferase family protein [Litorilinea aerophila]MCC9077059.1 2-oxo acid dehydrogenase subunit E2 [Litorilinea aerophila]
MPKEVYMPALGMNQETGTLLRWLKAEGEEVRQGEPLMEVATDKAEVEIEAPASGILRRVTAREGDEVPVGQVIALIAAPDEPFPQEAQAEPAAPPQPLPPSRPAVSPVAARIAAEHNVDLSQVQSSGPRIQKDDVLAHLAARAASSPQAVPRLTPASPKARRLAAEHGLDLAAVPGSGPAGAVLAGDVLAHLEQAVEPATPSTQALPQSRLWSRMVARLTESWQTVPHFYLAREVDAGRLMAWRQSLADRLSERVTYTDLLVKLVAVALRRHPRLNAAWHDGTIVANPAIHIGVAVAVEEGLLVPVIHHADTLGVAQIAARRKELVERAQAGRLTPDDLEGGTFTLSNLGMYGVDSFWAIVNPPQAAILAVGRIVEKVAPVAGQPAVRPMLALHLSCDHRVVDGARAAPFLDTLAALVEDPLRALD